MKKVAVIFPGQGAQEVGMGKDFYDHFPEARRIFDIADSTLGFPISDLCFGGPAEKLALTENTQPAVLTVSIAIYEVLKSLGFNPEMTAGHSLGEYSALVAAEVLDFKDALHLVRRRGLLMEEAVPAGEGGMAAVIGLSPGEVRDICSETDGTVVPANFNCPGQIVISGEAEAVQRAGKRAEDKGAKRVVFLDVSGPFHSPLMEPAARGLAEEAGRYVFRDASIPLVSNVDGKIYTDSEKIKENLIAQVKEPVLWEASIKTMLDAGITTFVEAGPGRVLTGFMRKIDRGVDAFSIRDLDSLEKFKKKLLKS